MAAKKKFEESRLGIILQSKGLDVALDYAKSSGLPGVPIVATALDALKDMIAGDKGGKILSTADKEEVLAAIKFEMELLDKMLVDIASARDMQKAALAQEDVFSKWFIYYFAGFWSVFAGVYMILVTFCKVPPENLPQVNTLTGFLIGTIISGIISYFFGSTAKSQLKDKTIAELTRGNV